MAAFSAVTFTLGERSKGTGVDESIPPSTSAYVDYSFSKLRQVLPELRGLTADPGHDRLASILNGVGEILADFFRKVPNLICHEHVERKGESEQGEFNYLILVHPTQGRDKILRNIALTSKTNPSGSAINSPEPHKAKGLPRCGYCFSLPSERVASSVTSARSRWTSTKLSCWLLPKSLNSSPCNNGSCFTGDRFRSFIKVSPGLMNRLSESFDCGQTYWRRCPASTCNAKLRTFLLMQYAYRTFLAFSGCPTGLRSQ